MIKRILVPTDGSDTSQIGVRYAAALAQSFEAHVQGIYVTDVKLLEGPFLQDLSASLGTAPYVNYQGNISMLLEERGKAALKALADACAEAGVPADTILASGVVPRVIVEHSGLADLIVMGRGGEHSEWLEGLVGSTAEAVIRRSPLPVLVTGTESLGKERILMAYDGSSHAQNALRTAVGFAEMWKISLKILVVGEHADGPVSSEVQSYLDAHNVDGAVLTAKGDPGEATIEFARSTNADLLVIGAYGHSKVRELVVGSTTTYVINHASCPVLLAR
ncbi:MAG: universal stress protein [Gammaproteobacteria bacterium]|nr:universal stress protein [Gammaproteobacteria bacterium]